MTPYYTYKMFLSLITELADVFPIQFRKAMEFAALFGIKMNRPMRSLVNLVVFYHTAVSCLKVLVTGKDFAGI